MGLNKLINVIFFDNFKALLPFSLKNEINPCPSYKVRLFAKAILIRKSLTCIAQVFGKYITDAKNVKSNNS